MRITTALRLASATLSNQNTQQPKYSATEILSNREHWSLIFAHRAKSKGNSDKPQCPPDRNRTDLKQIFQKYIILCVIWNKSVRFLAKRLLQKTQKSQTLSHSRCHIGSTNASATEKQKGDTKKRPLDLCSL